jgi:hypothetical protein
MYGVVASSLARKASRNAPIRSLNSACSSPFFSDFTARTATVLAHAVVTKSGILKIQGA